MSGSVKPVNRECVLNYTAKCRHIVTAEEHSVIGGLIANADPGTYLIDMTTTSSKLAVRIYENARKRGLKAIAYAKAVGLDPVLMLDSIRCFWIMIKLRFLKFYMRRFTCI